MATPVPVRDLWPDDLAKEPILTPLAILRVQASKLRAKTGGLLEGEITESAEGDNATYAFDLVAPALDRYRYRILEVTHGRQQAYPVQLRSIYLADDPRFVPDGVRPAIAYTQAAFMEKLASIFAKPECRAVIDSILAQSNEPREDSDPLAEAS